MGQAADDILDGLCCEQCGQWMPDVFDDGCSMFDDPPGYPRTCPECLADEMGEENGI
jgi:hypothetical protein